MTSKNSINMIQNDDLEVSNDEINLKPDSRGLYTLCFHCNSRQPPLYDENEIKEVFSSVAPIANIKSYKGLQFVRFTTKEFAIKALKAFRTELNIKVADHKKNYGLFKDQNSNSSTENSMESKNSMVNRKSQDHSTNNNHSGVMLYLGNVAVNTPEEEIKEFMSRIKVLEWKIVQKKNKCYAFLKVPNHKEAEKAVKLFHNASFKNRNLLLRVLRTFDPKAKSKMGNSVSSPAKEAPNSRENSKKGKKSTRVNHSTMSNSLTLDDLKSLMPPLENIDSSSDEDVNNDDGSNEVDLESAINGNTTKTNLNGYYHLFVGNFPYGTSEVNLMKLFQPYQPNKVIIINGNDKSRSTQGFVCFSNPRDLIKATEEMDCTKYENQILLVTSSVCCLNIQKDKNLQCTITAIPGESQYQRKVMLDTRYEKCRQWLNNSLKLNPELLSSKDK